MAPLKQRILRRAVPVGLATAVLGYAFTHFYLEAAKAYTGPAALRQQAGPNVQGPLVFGLAGLATMTALECLRRPRA
jgi:hypothetical protein